MHNLESLHPLYGAEWDWRRSARIRELELHDHRSMEAGTVSKEVDFLKKAMDHFTPCFQPLICCVNQLRKVVFLNGVRRDRPDEGLYDQMREVLLNAMHDPQVQDERSR